MSEKDLLSFSRFFTLLLFEPDLIARNPGHSQLTLCIVSIRLLRLGVKILFGNQSKRTNSVEVAFR